MDTISPRFDESKVAYLPAHVIFNLSANEGAISHWVLELSADITDANTFEIISSTGTEDNDSPTLWGGPTGAGSLGNPGLTEDIFGIKYNT